MLEDEATFLKGEEKRVAILHKNVIAQIVNDRKLKLETQHLTAQRLLNEEKLKVTELNITISALKDKIALKDDIIAKQARKCHNYDEITAQAVKFNILINACKSKADLR